MHIVPLDCWPYYCVGSSRFTCFCTYGLFLRLTPPISSISPPLYLILQTPLKDSLLYILFLSNSVLYISSSIHQKSVLGTYFASNFFTYVFIIPLNIMYIFYFNLICCIKYK